MRKKCLDIFGKSAKNYSKRRLILHHTELRIRQYGIHHRFLQQFARTLANNWFARPDSQGLCSYFHFFSRTKKLHHQSGNQNFSKFKFVAFCALKKYFKSNICAFNPIRSEFNGHLKKDLYVHLRLVNRSLCRQLFLHIRVLILKIWGVIFHITRTWKPQPKCN